MSMLKFETKRLELQPFKRDDAIMISELANDKELASILGLPHPFELTSCRRVDRYSARTN